MNVSYAFACLLVRNRDQAAEWYERFFGRPPTFLPNDEEAVWQVAPTASVYVLTDETRAGHSVVTLIVDDLDTTLAEIAERGITPGPVEEVTGAGRKSTTQDPDGNEVALVQLNATT